MFDVNEINLLDAVSKNFAINKRYVLSIAKKDKIDFVYNTSALEGNAMTYPEVQTLLEGITVGGHKLSDEHQVLNQNKSVGLLFDMIEDDIFRVDKNIICKLHFEVAKEEALLWGEFRDANVNIGGTEYLPPKFAQLEEIFAQGIKNMAKINDPILKAITYFLFGARMQFFFDGNKRTSRLVMNGILLSNGYPILNIKAKDKLEFNTKMIEFYDSENYTDALKYLADYYLKQNSHLI